MSLIGALNITKTGLDLQTAVVETTAMNLAAAGADSFQKLTVLAKDLPYMNQPPGAPTSSSGTINEIGFQKGTGVRVAGIQRSMQAADYRQTNDPLDIAIEGQGYYQILLPSGVTAYTRVASFRVDPQTNNLSTIEGYPLSPTITVPPQAEELMISYDGTVQVSQQGTAAYSQLGQIQLATFVNPSGLTAIGDTMFIESPASGTASIESPGTNNKGTIKQGWRENSNVNPVEEIVQLVQSQQQYESLTKVISTADEMLRATTH